MRRLILSAASLAMPGARDVGNQWITSGDRLFAEAICLEWGADLGAACEWVESSKRWVPARFVALLGQRVIDAGGVYTHATYLQGMTGSGKRMTVRSHPRAGSWPRRRLRSPAKLALLRALLREEPSLFTVGKVSVYDEYLTTHLNPRKENGGSAWPTWEEANAVAKLNEGFAVYRLRLDRKFTTQDPEIPGALLTTKRAPIICRCPIKPIV